MFLSLNFYWCITVFTVNGISGSHLTEDVLKQTSTQATLAILSHLQCSVNLKYNLTSVHYDVDETGAGGAVTPSAPSLSESLPVSGVVSNER